jgi:tRNA(Ile2) C34 agmatinyltransferase TiaS
MIIVKDETLAKDHPCLKQGHEMHLKYRMGQGSLGFWKCKRCGYEIHTSLEDYYKKKLEIKEPKKPWE